MIYRVNVDGTGLTRLTRPARDDQAAPSPNGDFIVFAGRATSTARSAPRNRDAPNEHAGAIQGRRGRVAGRPQGSVHPHRPGRFEQIFVMNVDGTHVTRVSRGDYYDFLPRWSPDGTRIAFTSSRDGTNGVYTMNADGSDVRDVSRTPLTLAMRPGIVVTQVNESLWAWR
jgi:Tol biopolymer transport system component